LQVAPYQWRPDDITTSVVDTAKDTHDVDTKTPTSLIGMTVAVTASQPPSTSGTVDAAAGPPTAFETRKDCPVSVLCDTGVQAGGMVTLCHAFTQADDSWKEMETRTRELTAYIGRLRHDIAAANKEILRLQPDVGILDSSAEPLGGEIAKTPVQEMTETVAVVSDRPSSPLKAVAATTRPPSPIDVDESEFEPDYEAEFEETWASVVGVAETLVKKMAKPPAREMTETPTEPSSSTTRTKRTRKLKSTVRRVGKEGTRQMCKNQGPVWTYLEL
jgi:hypothetical protein